MKNLVILSGALLVSLFAGHSNAALTSPLPAAAGRSEKDFKELPPCLSTPELIRDAVQYPGPAAEKKLTDLLKADFHYAQALYNLSKEKAGFMALERFERAHDRALGDIRQLSVLKEDQERLQKALEARQNWLGGFQRARFKDLPKAV